MARYIYHQLLRLFKFLLPSRSPKFHATQQLQHRQPTRYCKKQPPHPISTTNPPQQTIKKTLLSLLSVSLGFHLSDESQLFVYSHQMWSIPHKEKKLTHRQESKWSNQKKVKTIKKKKKKIEWTSTTNQRKETGDVGELVKKLSWVGQGKAFLPRCPRDCQRDPWPSRILS